MSDGVVAYSALATSFCVLSDRVDVLELVDTLWSPGLQGAPSEVLAEHTIELVDEPSGWLVAVDGEAHATDLHDSLVLERLHWEINELARASAAGRPLLHAACVAIDDVGVVLCGPSGSGKSTMTLGLCERGAAYLSDEIVPLRADDPNLIDSYRKPLSLRRDSWEFAVTMYPNSAASVASLMAETWFVAAPISVPTTRAELLVFVDYQHGVDAEISAIDQADALVALAEQTHQLASDGGPTSFATLGAFCRSVRCIRLRSGSLEDACDAVMQALV